MSDLFVVDLALNLRASIPSAELADLKWHLGHHVGIGEDRPDSPADETGTMTPLLAERGPAFRIGGVLTGELIRTDTGWSLTTRQEVHAESLHELDALVERLAEHSSTEGVIGQIRFYEEYCPELLINESGTLTKMSCLPS